MKKLLLLLACVFQSSLLVTMESSQKTTIQAVAASLATTTQAVSCDPVLRRAQNEKEFDRLPYNRQDRGRWCSFPGGSKELEYWRIGDLMLRCNDRPVDCFNRVKLSEKEVKALCNKGVKARQVGVLYSNPQFLTPFDQSINSALTDKKSKKSKK